jgi:hypothetical protein
MTHNLLKSFCPQCRHTFFRGNRGFGPAVVKCRSCGTEVNTGLPGWANLGGGRKAWQVIRELFTPTFFGSDSGFIRILLNLFVGCMVMALPIVPLSPLLKDAGSAGSMAILSISMIVGTSLYPAFLVLRIARMIRDAKRGDGETPVVW